MRKMNLIFYLLMLIPTAALATNGEDLTEVLRIRIAQYTTLSGIQKKLGQAQLVETGDAGDYKAAICYNLPKCQTKVEFWSSELGGPEHNLIGFTLSRSTNSSSVCAELAIDDCGSLKVPRGVKLGMTLDQYKEAIGSDVQLEGSYYQKAFERRQPMTEAERRKMLESHPDLSLEELYWDIVIFIRGAFRSGTLDNLEVSKTETN
jgi:hypothetical protein